MRFVHTGYGHVALAVEDLDGLLARLAECGIEPEKPPYAPGGRAEPANRRDRGARRTDTGTRAPRPHRVASR